MTIQDFLSKQRALCEAATPGPWFQDGPERAHHRIFAEREDESEQWCVALTWKITDSPYIASWSPDRVARVLAVVEAAQSIFDEGYDKTTLGWLGGQNPNMAKVPARLLDKLRAALAALEAP